MNAGGTMLRVYDALKARIKSGDFAPGERLDPARLALDHHASVTPVRDALHRLTGERLIDSWQQEGFRQPIVTEASLKDLYAHNADLLGLAMRRWRAAGIAMRPQDDGLSYPGRVAALFRQIAQHVDNRELWMAIESVNDRLHRVRMLEATTIRGCEDELHELLRCAQATLPFRRALAAYHLRRQRNVPILASLLRPREDGRNEPL